ncbi:hypothetical protein [Streptomyces zagrosensis]|uniref:Uncharacterized protein n=1 Tax=Streptomyces zagrosensis TaxID=1042984 RepID=A0A7W9Q5V9_9ACTN|nr:hypothetical protein [Streptomyces zagrosensis]MBB5934208.1 hypothetical protein [Streptomyces zagrosensis]
MSAGRRPVTAALIESVGAWSWVEETGAGPLAFLLLARPEASGPPLLRLADALGLVEPAAELPYLGKRVTVIGDTRVALEVPGADYLMEVKVGAWWAEQVGGGVPVAVVVGLAPLARCAPPEEVEAYLGVNGLKGQLRLGTALARTGDHAPAG